MATSTSGAIVTQGTKLYRGTKSGSSVLWDRVRGVSSFSGPNTSKSKIDVTSFDSNRKEYIYGIPDEGDISFNLFFYPTDAIHKAILKEDSVAAYNRPWRLELSDGSVYEFEGNVSSAPLTGDMDAAVAWSLTISVSGSAEWSFANDLATVTWDNSLSGSASTGNVTGNVTMTLSSNTEASYSFAQTISADAYTIDNVPEGLTPSVTRTSATKLTLAFSGTATDKTDVTDISVVLKDAAFADIKASEVSGYSKDNVAIIFA